MAATTGEAITAAAGTTNGASPPPGPALQIRAPLEPSGSEVGAILARRSVYGYSTSLMLPHLVFANIEQPQNPWPA
jgi:hypothetical protein